MEQAKFSRKIDATRRSMELTRRACDTLLKHLLAEEARDKSKQEEWEKQILKKLKL